MVCTNLFLLVFDSSFFRIKVNPWYPEFVQELTEYVKSYTGFVQELTEYVKSYTGFVQKITEYEKSYTG